MVGFDPSSKSELSTTEYSFAGAGSGAVTRFLCQPLDVLKIRFQLQVEPICKKYADSKYQGVSQAVRCIVKEEGFTALWKGHVPAQFLSVTFGIAQFTSFETLTSQCWKLFPTFYNNNKAVTHFSCGAVAGCFATIVSFPFDVIRTRLVAQGELKVYRGIMHAFSVIYLKDGIFTLFRGLSPTLIQIAPQSGAQFGFYKAFTNLWENIGSANGNNRDAHISVYEPLICGSLAGICAKTLIYPLDLTKKRLQIQGFENARSGFGKMFYCSGLVHCISATVKAEGLVGLFKGLWPSLLKAAATTAVHFAAYEQICALLLSLHH